MSETNEKAYNYNKSSFVLLTSLVKKFKSIFFCCLFYLFVNLVNYFYPRHLLAPAPAPAPAISTRESRPATFRHPQNNAVVVQNNGKTKTKKHVFCEFD